MMFPQGIGPYMTLAEYIRETMRLTWFADWPMKHRLRPKKVVDG